MNPLDILRPYQRDALEALWKSWDAGGTRVAIVMATGLGKTKIFTRAVYRWLEENKSHMIGTGNRRVLVIAHTDELIEQAAKEMRLACPGYSVGIVQGTKYNETHCRIIVSTRQTLVSEKRRAQIRNVGLIVVDECHHALRSNTYGKILEYFGAYPDEKRCKDPECYGGCYAEDPTVKVLGVTATLSRSNEKEKLSSVWESVAFRRDILFGIRQGFLLDVRAERVTVADFNLNNVKVSGGDYQESALAEELERTFAPEKAAETYAVSARASDGRLRQGIAFWPLVETAYHGAEAFEAAGISSAVIHGGLEKEERKLILKRFREGDITVIHNCMVLTEGFDAPWADVVVIARPTRSAALYQQMVGRVLRPNLEIPAEQREKALILDVTGAGEDCDLRSLIDLSPERALKKPEDGDDFSLLELDDALFEFEEVNTGGSVLVDAGPLYDGAVTTVAYDPLRRDSVWGTTPDGTHYMTAGGTHYIFLFEVEPAKYDVIWCEKRGRAAGLTDYRALPLEDALTYGEDEAFERGGVGAKTLANRKAPWRKKPCEIGSPQQKLALRLGVWREGMLKGECSEAIDAANAASRIDPQVRAVRAMMEKDEA